MTENKNTNNNPILETKEFKVLLNLLEKAEQIISIINLSESSISKYNTLKKMTFDILNLDFIPLQKKYIENKEPKENNETIKLLYMLNTQKIMLIDLLLNYVINNNSIEQRKDLNHFLGALTDIYNLSKEPFSKKTEEEIFYEINNETNKLSELFTKIDKIFVDNFDALKQVRINYENELNKLKENYDKDLDELKMSLSKNSYRKSNLNSNPMGNNYYLNKISSIIDEAYEKYKKFSPEEYSLNSFNVGSYDIDKSKLDFLGKIINKFFDDNNRLKRSDLNLNSSMNYRISQNSYKDDKLNDICSFLPEVQRESDSFHKKFCELMNYIETNIEGSIN